MHKLPFVFAAACAAALSISCGHNSIQYGDGVGFEFGINPDNWSALMTLHYGKILTAVTRDNVEIELTGNASADAQTGELESASTEFGTDGNLKIRIGRQINGAAVDLVKAGASADKVIEALANEKKQ